MSTAAIIGQISITKVYAALGGPELRAGRGRAFWRDGDGYNVALKNEKGAWSDHAAGEGGGVIDLVVRVRGGTRVDALRWCAELAGVPMEDGRLSPADRQRWAAERRAVEQHLPDAYRWRRAAIGLGEDLLAVLKSRLFDPTQPAPDVGELQHLEALIARLRRIDDALLVHEYRDWQRLQPGMVAAMVASMRRRERAERTALETYLGQAEAVRVMDIEGLIAAELEAQRAKRMNGGAGNGSAATLRVPIIERPFTDAGNAERLHALYGGRFRYSHPQRTFFVWDGRRWAPDDKGVM